MFVVRFEVNGVLCVYIGRCLHHQCVCVCVSVSVYILTFTPRPSDLAANGAGIDDESVIDIYMRCSDTFCSLRFGSPPGPPIEGSALLDRLVRRIVDHHRRLRGRIQRFLFLRRCRGVHAVAAAIAAIRLVRMPRRRVLQEDARLDRGWSLRPLRRQVRLGVRLRLGQHLLVVLGRRCAQIRWHRHDGRHLLHAVLVVVGELVLAVVLAADAALVDVRPQGALEFLRKCGERGIRILVG